MRKISLALAFIASLLTLPAQAANFSAKDAAAATIVFVNPQNCTTGCVPIFSWYDSTGANAVAVITAGADGASNTANGGLTYGRNLVFNGTTWDRWTGAVTNAGTFAVQLTGATNNINNIAGTISLPTGAATSAAQTTAQTSLSSIDTKTPALGQALAAASVPVILPAATITTLTPPTTVTVTQATSSNLKAQVDPLTAASWAIGATAAAVPANAHYWGVNISGNQVGVTGLALGATTKAPTVAIVDGSGNQITAFGGSGGTASNFGSTFPTAGTATGFSDGTNMVAGRVTAYGTTPTGLNALAVNAFVTNTNANGQATAANSSPVVLPAAQVTVDPCSLGNKTNVPISQSGTSSVQLVALSGATTIYVCSLSLIAAGATTAVLTTGTGTACVTGNAAVIGDTTANIANGLSFAASGGLTLGNGAGTIAKGAASGELCMTLGTNVRMSGNMTVVQQ